MSPGHRSRNMLQRTYSYRVQKPNYMTLGHQARSDLHNRLILYQGLDTYDTWTLVQRQRVNPWCREALDSRVPAFRIGLSLATACICRENVQVSVSVCVCICRGGGGGAVTTINLIRSGLRPSHSNAEWRSSIFSAAAPPTLLDGSDETELTRSPRCSSLGLRFANCK